MPDEDFTKSLSPDLSPKGERRQVPPLSISGEGQGVRIAPADIIAALEKTVAKLEASAKLAAAEAAQARRYLALLKKSHRLAGEGK